MCSHDSLIDRKIKLVRSLSNMHCCVAVKNRFENRIHRGRKAVGVKLYFRKDEEK